MRNARSSRLPQGYSLMELMAVVAVVAILMVVAMPAWQQITGATALTKNGAAVVSQLALAREAAEAHGRPAQVRFFRDGASSEVRSTQVFTQQADGTWQAFSALLRLNGAHVDLALSTAFDPSLNGAANAGDGYVAITFRADGSLSIPVDAALDQSRHLTLVKDGWSASAPGDLPLNYFVIQVHAMTGRPLVSRP